MDMAQDQADEEEEMYKQSIVQKINGRKQTITPFLKMIWSSYKRLSVLSVSESHHYHFIIYNDTMKFIEWTSHCNDCQET